jgi:glycosyltransferase involved in cell wall biosynthesis
MTERPSVLLLIPHLGGGGAERVTALLAKGLPGEKYEVHVGLVTGLTTETDSSVAQFAPHIKVHALGARRVRGGALGLLRLIRRTKPDLILSGMAHLNFLVLLLRPFFPRETRVLVRQNATVSAVLGAGGLPSYTRLLYRLLYRHADYVICQTRAMAVDLTAETGVFGRRIVVLPNPVDLDSIRARMTEPVDCWTPQGLCARGTPGSGWRLPALARKKDA